MLATRSSGAKCFSQVGWASKNAFSHKPPRGCAEYCSLRLDVGIVALLRVLGGLGRWMLRG